MARRYHISDQVSDSVFISPLMSASYTVAELSTFQFFDASGAQVTPSAGTITIEGSPDGANYFTVDHGTFNAADVYDKDRTRPNAANLMINFRIVLSGVTGADNFLCEMWRA